MAIDVEATAAGRWTLKAAPADGTDPTAGDFAVLAGDPYAPESRVVLSTRITSLVAGGSVFPSFVRAPAGRLNVSPSSIGLDNLVYCYDEDLATSTFSYLVRMTTAQEMKMEKVAHAAGSSVCNAAPSTWAFSANAVDLIR
ncbi:MAG: hypothetical protein HY908_07355 [Myxococcales bacterium]|nr:hypothetical protein [Myxococcales bacterium]